MGDEAHGGAAASARDEALARRRLLDGLWAHLPLGLVLTAPEAPYRVLLHNDAFRRRLPEALRDLGMKGQPLAAHAATSDAATSDAVAAHVEARCAEAARTAAPVHAAAPQARAANPAASEPAGQAWLRWTIAPVVEDDAVVALAHLFSDASPSDADAAPAARADLFDRKAWLEQALGAAGGLVYASDQAAHQIIGGVGFEQVVGEAPDRLPCPDAWWTDRVHPDDRAEVRRAVHAAATGIEAGATERLTLTYRVRHRQGHYLHVRDTGRLHRTPGGGAVHYVGTVFDVTAERHTETRLRRLGQHLEREVEARTEALRESEERFRTLSEVAFEALLVLKRGLVVDANRRAVELFGRRALADLRGRPALDLVAPAHRDAVANAIERGHTDRFDAALVRPGGAEVPVEVRMRRARYRGATVQVAAVRDISHRKQAEARLRDLARTLTMAEQRERKRLSRTLHDDVQQTLFALRMHLQMLRERCHVASAPDVAAPGASGPSISVTDAAAPEASAADVHAAMMQGFDNLDRLVAGAAHTARTLAVELTPPVLRDDGLAEALRWLADHLRERYGLRVTLDLAELPFTPPEDERILIVQLARDLLLNVVEHASTRDARLTLGSGKNGSLRLVVADEGLGFDLDHLRREASETDEATGLFSVEKRVRLLGGTFHVEAAPGNGARVTLRMPPPSA